MKNIFILGLLILLATVDARAATNTAIQSVNNQANVSAEYIPTQTNNAPLHENSQYLKGHQLGMGFSLTKTFYQRLYAQIALNTFGGNLSYGKNTPLSTATSVLEQASIRFGYSFFPTQTLALTPYLTTGYQFWQLDTGGKAFKDFLRNGDTKIYQNGFYGLGLLSQFAVTPRLVASLDTLLGQTINPWMHYNPAQVPNSDIGTNIIYQQASLSPQPFYQIGLNLDYKVTSKLHATTGVQYDHIQYGGGVTNPSKLITPHVSTAYWNYNVGFGYSFEDANKSIDDTYYDANEVDAIMKVNNQANLLYGYDCQGYAETLPGLGYYFDRQVGNIPIVAIALNKTFERIYTQLSMGVGEGNTEYKGTQSTSSSYTSFSTFNTSTRNTLFDAGARLGYLFFPNEKTGLTPYVAGGFHRWLRDTGGVPYNQYITSGYPETYQNAWYAVGLLTQFTPYPHWVLSVDGNVGTIENAENKSWNSFNSPDTYQQIFSLKQRFLFDLGVGGDYQFQPNWHALAQANYSYFKYGKSTPSKLGIFEPNSTTRQLTLLVGIGYALDTA